LPPAKFIYDEEDRLGLAVNSMVSGGCIICGAVVRHSLLFSNARIESEASVTDSVILPNVVIERRCRIRRAVIDKGCRLTAGTVIGENAEEDSRRFYVSPRGVVLVTPEMLGQQVHHVR
jgi:glucose-1-phosphate adenylyltransferase